MVLFSKSETRRYYTDFGSGDRREVTVPSLHKIGSVLTVGFEGERIYSAIAYSYAEQKEFDPYIGRNEMNNYLSLRVGLNLLKRKTLLSNSYKKQVLPIILLETGLVWLIPISKSAQAASANVYIEPKLALFPNFSFGFRLEDAGVGIMEDLGVQRNWMGYDTDQFSRYYFVEDVLATSIDGTSLIFRGVNRMSLVSAKLGKAAYYHEIPSGWLVFDVGAGVYKKDGVEAIIGFDENGQERIIPEIPAAKNFGVSIGTDFKTGMFRTGFDFNFTGKDIPNYFNFQIAVEPGFGGKWREKIKNEAK